MRIGVAALAAVLAAPALAQQSGGGAAVYQITPAESGFTRLDTRSGSLTHCRLIDGVWHCEPIDGGAGDAAAAPVSDAGGDDTTVTDLAARLEALAAKVEVLAERVAAQEAAAAAPAPEPAVPVPSPPAAAKPAPAPAFAAQVVARFVEMVRRLKVGAEPG